MTSNNQKLTIHTDPDYIVPRGLPSSAEGATGAAARRSAAMKNWLQARTNTEFEKALEQIEQSPNRESWRIFRHRNGRTLVRTLRIHSDRPCDPPDRAVGPRLTGGIHL